MVSSSRKVQLQKSEDKCTVCQVTVPIYQMLGVLSVYHDVR